MTFNFGFFFQNFRDGIRDNLILMTGPLVCPPFTMDVKQNVVLLYYIFCLCYLKKKKKKERKLKQILLTLQFIFYYYYM